MTRKVKQNVNLPVDLDLSGHEHTEVGFWLHHFNGFDEYLWACISGITVAHIVPKLEIDGGER